MKIFISHSARDQAIYLTLCLALDASLTLSTAQISRWDVSAMSAGESLADQLRSAISECQICVFIATRRSIESQWCLAELGAFWGSGKTVVLFIVDPDLDDSILPPQFKGNLRARTPQELINTIQLSAARLESLIISPSSFCRKIPNRRELYIESRTLIETSDVIRDTTWGRRARELGEEEKRERELYRTSIAVFMRQGKDYHELLTAEKRTEYLQESYSIKRQFSNYQCRILRLDISTLAIIDMMIADRNRVLFSHVSAEDPTRKVQYLSVESELIAELFLQFYSDAWRSSVDILKYFDKDTNELILDVPDLGDADQ